MTGRVSWIALRDLWRVYCRTCGAQLHWHFGRMVCPVVHSPNYGKDARA